MHVLRRRRRRHRHRHCHPSPIIRKRESDTIILRILRRDIMNLLARLPQSYLIRLDLRLLVHYSLISLRPHPKSLLFGMLKEISTKSSITQHH